jgi:hypothetical protein
MTYPDRINPVGLQTIAEQLGYFVTYGETQDVVPSYGKSEYDVPSKMRDMPPEEGTNEAAQTGPDIRFGESFKLYMVDADKIYSYRPKRKSDPLFDLAKDTGRWHHQVKFDGVAKAFARSIIREEDPQAASLREFFASPLAVSIDAGIRWIDKHVSENLLVRLLSVPSHRVEAFWLLDEATHKGSVLIVDAPPALKELPRERLIGSQVFLEVLSRERPSGGFG